MPPAARVGDKTSHSGTPLGPGPGSSNVLIGGIPAWRATVDVYLCPLVSPGNVPHGNGSVTGGSATVLINGRPAARQGDVIEEKGGPPNAIATGCKNVLIGD